MTKTSLWSAPEADFTMPEPQGPYSEMTLETFLQEYCEQQVRSAAQGSDRAHEACEVPPCPLWRQL